MVHSSTTKFNTCPLQRPSFLLSRAMGRYSSQRTIYYFYYTHPALQSQPLSGETCSFFQLRPEPETHTHTRTHLHLHIYMEFAHDAVCLSFCPFVTKDHAFPFFLFPFLAIAHTFFVARPGEFPLSHLLPLTLFFHVYVPCCACLYPGFQLSPAHCFVMSVCVFFFLFSFSFFVFFSSGGENDREEGRVGAHVTTSFFYGALGGSLLCFALTRLCHFRAA